MKLVGFLCADGVGPLFEVNNRLTMVATTRIIRTLDHGALIIEVDTLCWGDPDSEKTDNSEEIPF